MTSRHSGIVTPTNSTVFTAVTPGRSHHRTFFDIRSRHSIVPGDDSDDADLTDEALSELVKKTWNIWAVSPLFGLDCKDEVKLKKYAKRLRENLASSLTEENVSYDAKFTPLQGLVNNPRDPPALEVQVNSTKDQEDDVICIYKGIFLSWGQRLELERDAVKLPLLLSRGTQTVTYAVHSVLCQSFDCLITAMPASQEDLMWLSTIILHSHEKVGKRKSKAAGELVLEYHIPGLPPSDFIVVKFPLASVETLWSKICPPHQSSVNPSEQAASVVKLEQVTKFYECIRIQMLDNSNLELGFCLLDKISLPSLTIKSNKMKATNIDTLDRVLWFFQEKALLYTSTHIATANIEED